MISPQVAIGGRLAEVVSFGNAFDGAARDQVRVRVPSGIAAGPTGPVRMTVPKGANTGTVLRLRGKGAPRSDKTQGDEYVTLKIVLPQQLDPELEEFARRWQAGQSQNPRGHLEA